MVKEKIPQNKDDKENQVKAGDKQEKVLKYEELCKLINQAIKEGDTNKVESLVNQKRPWLEDLGHFLANASRNGDLETVKLLSKEVPDKFNYTSCLWQAANQGHLNIIRFLLDKTEIDTQELDRLTMEALVDDQLEVVKFLFDNKGVKLLDNDGQAKKSFFQYAIGNSPSFEILDYLMSRWEKEKN